MMESGTKACEDNNEAHNEIESKTSAVQDASNSSTSSDIPGAQAYDKLQSATSKAIKRLTSKTKVLPYMKEHFRQFYKADSKYVLDQYKSMMDQLHTMIKEEIQLQLDANEVQHLLAELERTVQDVPHSDRKWRPSGKPEEDIKAHLQDSQSKKLQQLEKILSTIELQNKLLTDHVARTDQKLEKSFEKLQSHTKAWEKAASIMTDDSRKTLINTVSKQNTA